MNELTDLYVAFSELLYVSLYFALRRCVRKVMRLIFLFNSYI